MTRKPPAAKPARRRHVGRSAAAARDPPASRPQPARARARLELSPSSISQIETGKMQPSVRTLYAFVVGVRGHRRRGALRPGPAPDGASRPSRSPGRGRPRARGAARGGTSDDLAQLRRDVGAADVLGRRGRRVHRGDLPAGRLVRPRRCARAPQRARVRLRPQRRRCASSSGSTSSCSGPATRSPSRRRRHTGSATRAPRRCARSGSCAAAAARTGARTVLTADRIAALTTRQDCAVY